VKLIVLDERISPLTLQGVAIGSHSILIKKDGYSEYRGNVHVVSDQASGLSVTLTGIVTVAPTSVPTQPLLHRCRPNHQYLPGQPCVVWHWQVWVIQSGEIVSFDGKQLSDYNLNRRFRILDFSVTRAE